MFRRKNHVLVFATVTKHDDNASKEVGQLFLLSGVISIVDWGKSITFDYNSFRSYVTNPFCSYQFQGIIIACYMMNKSLIFLILVTVAWIVVIIVENAALSFNSYCFLVVVGVFRMICLTAVCIVPM